MQHSLTDNDNLNINAYSNIANHNSNADDFSNETDWIARSDMTNSLKQTPNISRLILILKFLSK